MYLKKTISNNPALKGLVSYVPNVPYMASDSKTELQMQLLLPQEVGEEKRFPLIVFIQGSAWTTPDTCWEIPQLSQFARLGFVVASVTHRPSKVACAPAFLEDVKSAIRFLRANAEKYRIDKSRVCAWGTSSGGNTALLLGVTGDKKAFDVGGNLEESSAVQCVVDCFGPADLVAFIDYCVKSNALAGDEPLMRDLAGGDVLSHMDTLKLISPIEYIDEKPLPPFLLLHGDADPVVPLDQSVRFFDRMQKFGHEASLVTVTDAPHEGNFWSQELLNEIRDFILEKL